MHKAMRTWHHLHIRQRHQVESIKDFINGCFILNAQYKSKETDTQY